MSGWSACRRLALSALCLMAIGAGGAAGPASAPAPALKVRLERSHGPLLPTTVPVLEGMNVGKQFMYGPLVGRPARGQSYQPAGGDSFAIRNGPNVCHFILTSGAWWLRVGDKPILRMELRSSHGAYASPSLLAGLGVSGQFRLAVIQDGQRRWLDEFPQIDAVLSPGSGRWTCRDEQAGLTVRLEARPLVGPWGFAVVADVSGPAWRQADLEWRVEQARHAGDKDGWAEFSAGKFAQVFVGAVEKGPPPSGGVTRVPLRLAGADRPVRSRLLCVWGYRDYDRQAVADAYKRLEFRPFHPPWLEQMKAKWFEHWVGGGLEPERKFQAARAAFDETLKQAEDFWSAQRRRLTIRTPDARFDNVVNHVSARSRVLFEYPGFIHGLGYAKYGKINHGCYGFDAAGLHAETADTLQFIAGSQDVAGRQRYFMTTFAISNWHEDMDFYFPEQCWYHWRWTGDESFARATWPAARRALEHGLASADADGDGVMTGYYEMWNSDQCNFGGQSALETAMGWAALRAGRDLAAALGDVDYAGQHGSGRGCDPDYARRYGQWMQRAAQGYANRLWNKDAGAWSSADHGGPPRSRPHTCEQNYAIRRGLGDPMRNYMAMRFVRENYHRRDLLAGSTLEFINDWWPIQWSHHYVASGDTCASFHSACAAGDVDGFWPAFKTVAESAYVAAGRSGHSPGATLWQGTGSPSMEIDPLFLHAVVDGLLGVQPWFGQNLLVIRPSPPTGWDFLEVRHADVEYDFRRDPAKITLKVRTPVARAVRAELPVHQATTGAFVNGAVAEVDCEEAVGAARIILNSPPGREHVFEIRLAGKPVEVRGERRMTVGGSTTFHVRGANLCRIEDPQRATETLEATGDEEQARFTLKALSAGKKTVFVRLFTAEAIWLCPLDLDIRPAVEVVQRLIPPLNAGGPAAASPSIDPKTRTLTLEVRNNSAAELAGPARVLAAGQESTCELRIPAFGSQTLRLDVASTWDRLSPGSQGVSVGIGRESARQRAVLWDLGTDHPSRRRMRPVDLSDHCNTDMSRLFSPASQWRIDYTGSQHGVDRRAPLPPRDELGCVLLNSVLSVFEYGTLPEQVPAIKRIEFAAMPERIESPVPFQLVTDRTRGARLVALCRTQPHEQFPSRITLVFDRPRRIEKVYLLTANIVKTLKCYYPAAEVCLRYAGAGPGGEAGRSECHQLIPPYSMPSVVGHICPAAHAILVGKLVGGGNPVADTACYLSVTDIVAGSAEPVAAIELRSVTTETLLGLAGMTLLEREE